MTEEPKYTFSWKTALVALALVVPLWLTARYNYLLFHSLAELFSIIIACGVFAMAWNTRRYFHNNYLLFVGIAYLFVAFFDTLHTLAYKGMNIFTGFDDDNLPPQIWLVARYLEAFSLLWAPAFFRRTLNTTAVFAGYGCFTVLALLSLFYWEIVPVCFVEGAGLTTFKIVSEYAICAILAAATWLLLKNRDKFNRDALELLVLSMLATIATELCFTWYMHLYSQVNMLGHLFKIVAFALMYQAVIATSLLRPYSSMFRELKLEVEERKRAQDSLAEEAAKVRLLLSSAAEGIYGVDVDGRCVFANPACLRLLGYESEAELIGKDMRLVIQYGQAACAPDSPATCPILLAIRTGEGSHADNEAFVRKDLSTFPAEYWSYPMRKDNAVVGAVVTFLDITERKLNERIIAGNEAHYKALHELGAMADASREAIARKALEHAVALTKSAIGYLHFVHNDQVNLELFHWSQSVQSACQAGQQRCYPLALAGIWADCVRTRQPAIHNDYPDAPGARGLPDGHVPVNRHMSIPIMEEGRILAVVGVGNKAQPYDAFDVKRLTRFFLEVWQLLARREAEAALRDNQDLLNQTQAIGKVGGWALNLSTGVRNWTREALRLMRFAEDTSLAPEQLSRAFEPLDGHELDKAVARASQSGEPFDLDLRLAHNGLEQRWVRIIGKRSDIGNQRILSGIIQDITDRKSLEALREDFERIARHDLKTPLNGIIGLPQVLLYDENLTEDQRNTLRLIEESGHKMLNMINISLVLYRMERGQYEADFSRLDVLRPIRKAVAELSSLALAKRLTLALTLQGLPATEQDVFFVRGEELLCYSMLANLIKNAVESSPAGETVSIALDQADAPRITIRNKGEVPAQCRAAFFDKYVTSGKPGGTGLGTYSARLMARTLGGDIDLDTSEPGATTITVRFPQA